MTTLEPAAASGNSFLDLRLQPAEPEFDPVRKGAHERSVSAFSAASDVAGADALKSCVSTSSLHEPLGAGEGISVKVSLWDLRCEVKDALEKAGDEETVTLPTESVNRFLDVMREHIQHRKIERALKKECKAAHSRLENLYREIQRLKSQVSLTPTTSDGSDGVPPKSPMKTSTTAHWATNGSLPFAGNNPAAPWAAPAEDARTTRYALVSRESMDAQSLKSDLLTGEETAALKGTQSSTSVPDSAASAPPTAGKKSNDQMKQYVPALHALAEERRRAAALEQRVDALQREAEKFASEEKRNWGFMDHMSHVLRRRSDKGDGSKLDTSRSAYDAADVPASDVYHQLATAKVNVAELEGELASQKRTVKRQQEEIRALQVANSSMCEERDRALEEAGALIVQLHVLEDEKTKLQDTLSKIGMPMEESA